MTTITLTESAGILAAVLAECETAGVEPDRAEIARASIGLFFSTRDAVAIIAARLWPDGARKVRDTTGMLYRAGWRDGVYVQLMSAGPRT